MLVSVEISFYPLQENYHQPILTFINRINKYTNIEVSSNGMSTQVFGEYQDVMKSITIEIEKAIELPNSIFILKIANQYLRQTK